MTTTQRATHYRWEDLPRERLNENLERRFITGERSTLAHLYMKKGCFVPTHTHESEQLTYVVEGALRLWVGDDSQQVVVRSGEVLQIPSKVPHGAEALEDTLDIDFFAPVREDWLAKKDDYLRRGR